MRKIIYALISISLISQSIIYANTQTPAKDISVVTSTFNKNLNSSNSQQQSVDNVVDQLNVISSSPMQCNAGYFPLGIDTSGNVRNCTPVPSSSGTVTSVSTSSPLTGGTITTSGTIGITQSTTSTNGYLSSADWNIFNGKQDSGSYITALTGDITASGPGSAISTLATVNGNVGSFTTANITVNAKGLITSASNGTGGVTSVSNSDGTITSSPTTGAVVVNRPAITGDISIPTSSNSSTLATVNTNTGSFGSSTAIPNFIVNGKGLITAAGTNAVVAPAGTLTGTTLASNVVTSSLTTVGTIISGIWHGTAIDYQHGGIGLTTAPLDDLVVGNGTGWTLTALTSCSGGSNALTYNTSTHAFGCNTINGGVTSITGTANQVIASASTGAVTLSTPQDIGTGSSPQFSDINLSGLTISTPVITDASKNLSSGSYSGNTTKLVTTTGSLTSGDCVKIDASGNFIANGSSCGGTSYWSESGGNTLYPTNSSDVNINLLGSSTSLKNTTGDLSILTTSGTIAVDSGGELDLESANGLDINLQSDANIGIHSSNGNVLIATNGSSGNITLGAINDIILLASVGGTNNNITLDSTSSGGKNIFKGTNNLFSLTASTPLLLNSSKDIVSGSLSGNTTKIVTNTGTNTSGNLLKWDSNGNAIDAGVTPLTAGYWTLSSTNLYSPTADTVTVGTSSTSLDLFTTHTLTNGQGSTDDLDFSGIGGIDSYTVLMLHLSASPFVDSSTNNYTVTNTNITLDTTNKVLGAAGSATSTGGSGRKLSIANVSNFDISSGEWTIDFQRRVGTITGTMVGKDTSTGWSFGENLGNHHFVWSPNSTTGVGSITSSTTIISGTFYHLAVVGHSGTTTLYVNGISEGTSATAPGEQNTPLTLFNDAQAGDMVDGNIQEFRFSKGIARWTSNFTPPASPYTNSVGTVCHTLDINSSTTSQYCAENNTNTAYIKNNSIADITFDNAGNSTMGGNLTTSAHNIITDTTTGTSFGTGTNQKTSAYGVTPVVQGGATTDLGTILSNWGLRVSGTAYPITTSGSVSLNGPSTTTTQSANDNSTKIATTAYVDNATLSQNYKEAAKYATTATLPTVVYSNGSSGVGATLTGAGVGALSLDSSTPSVNDRVLVKNQVSTFQNGIYTVTAVGSGIAVFVMTRAIDANQSAEFKTGDAVFTTAGTTQSNTTWAYTGVDSPTIGTDTITYAQIAGQGSFTASNGVSITGTVISGVNAIADGSTKGVATFTSTDFTASSGVVSSMLSKIANIDLTNYYTFTVTSANATAGSTYTNNGQTFTVQATIASSVTLVTTGTGAPAASGTLTKASGTGDSTITFSTKVQGVSSFTISGLTPGIRYHLIFNLSQNTSNGFPKLTINSDTGSNYQNTFVYSNGSTTAASNRETIAFAGLSVNSDTVDTGRYVMGIVDFQTEQGNSHNTILNIYTNYYHSAPLIMPNMVIYSGSSDLTTLTIGTSAATITGTGGLYVYN